MDSIFSILTLFPLHLAGEIQQVILREKITPEELRVRRGQPVCIRSAGRECFCRETVVTAKDINYIILNATNGAFHSAIERLQNGYLPLSGGCRLGLCGEGAVRDGVLHNIRHISSLCIRIARQLPCCGDELIPKICDPSFRNTIIIAPPGAGKTTLLRELIRKLSDLGNYVCVADERGEIAGMYQGEPSFDLGPRCDITYGIPKQMAAMMLLRTMAPDILAMDEITALRDTSAVVEAIGCGVGLLTTMHGRDVKDLSKPGFSAIFETQAFERAIMIELKNGKRQYHVEKL